MNQATTITGTLAEETQPRTGPARRLFDAGFRDLISVIPPRVDLSERSSVHPSQRGKVPGKKISDGWCGFTKWPDHETSLEDTETWDKWGSNIGMKDPFLPGFDLDIDDGPLCDEVFAIAKKTFGPGPTRLSKEHRRLIVYRTAEPFGWMGLEFEVDGQHHLVEILGQRNQYLVHGTHPSGAQYRWDGKPLWEWDREEIPLITLETASRFLEEISALFKKRGIPTDITGRGANTKDTPPQEDLKAPSLEALARVVRMIPNPADWRWRKMVKMGYAIKAAGQDDESAAKDIFLKWTSKWEGKHDLKIDLYNWNSFGGPFRIGWSWLQSQAAATGLYNGGTDNFPVIYDGEPPDPKSINPRLLALEELNETYAVVQLGSDVVILQEQGDGEVAFLKTSAFSLKFKNRKVPSATDLRACDKITA